MERQDDDVSEVNFQILSGVEFPKFRTVEDFVLDKARFELPPFGDFPRWNNRIISNLLYYQTNYFAVFFTLVIFATFLQAQDFAIGLMAIVAVAAAAFFTLSPNFIEIRRDHQWLTLGGIVITCYAFISVLPSVATVLISLCIPLLIVLLHASTRLRNFRAKIHQQTERLGLKKTVMNAILQALGVDVRT